MTRGLLESSYTCYVCGHTFVVRDGDTNGMPDPTISVPGECPLCSAPVRWVADIKVGKAKDLLLTHYGARYERRQHGGVKELLLASCLGEQDVDAYLSLVEHMDYDAWKTLDDALHGGKPSPAEKQGAKIREEARADAEAGRLLPSLHEAAEGAKSALRAEHARYLAIYRERRGES